MGKIKYSNAQKDKLIKGIFDGSVDAYNLPKDLYLAIAEDLKSGLYKGFGGSLKSIGTEFGFGSAPAELLEELRINTYQFSAAKTFNMVEEMRGALVDGDRVLPYDEFKAKADTLFETYNETWLETEYNTAIAEAEIARQYTEAQEDKELFPYLRYVTAGDANVSDICAPLDGTVLHVDDPFWDTFLPPNHFNCRCVIEQLETPEG